MKKTPFILFAYALTVLTGGLIGYIQAASLPSLLSGIIFGSLLFSAALFSYKKEIAAYWIAFSLSLVLQGFFIWRFAKTLSFFPAGFLSFLTLVMLIILSFKLKKELRSS